MLNGIQHSLAAAGDDAWDAAAAAVMQELSAELLRGFAECLELEDAEVLKPVEDEFIGQ